MITTYERDLGWLEGRENSIRVLKSLDCLPILGNSGITSKKFDQ